MSAPEAEACTVTWETGALELTVSCPHGRTWVYEVFPVGDKPLPHLLWDLPWMLVPGSEWRQEGEEGAWSAVVVPVSAETAGDLFAIRKPELRAFG